MKIKEILKNRQKFFIGPGERFVFKVALIYFLLFHLPTLYAMYDTIAYGISGKVGLKNIIIYSLTFGSLYFGASLLLIGFLIINRWVFYLLTPVIFILSGVLTYFICGYKVVFSPATTRIIFNTQYKQSAELIGLPLMGWMLFTLIVSFGIIKLYNKAHITVKSPYILFMLLFMPFFIASVGSNFNVPFNFLNASFYYMADKISVQKRKNFAAIQFHDNPAVVDDLTVVWVIGESVRTDHWHINGYERDTTPFIDTIPHIVNFNKATSCANFTDLSVSCMLTGASPQNLEPAYDSSSFLSIFKRVGFPVFWVSNNPSIREPNLNIRQIISSFDEVDKIYDTNTDGQSMLANALLSGSSQTNKDADENMLPVLDQLLKEHPKKVFIVIHLNGSHWKYYNRYPKNFEKYKPVCTESSYFMCSKDSIINAYDNSILYTDFILGGIIDRLKSRKAMLWYASDHGELLGERGLWNHMNADKGPEQYTIPMLWWGSDAFIQHYPQIYASLKAHKNQAISHTNIFPSTLDCASIQATVIHKELSLCQ